MLVGSESQLLHLGPGLCPLDCPDVLRGKGKAGITGAPLKWPIVGWGRRGDSPTVAQLVPRPSEVGDLDARTRPDADLREADTTGSRSNTHREVGLTHRYRAAPPRAWLTASRRRWPRPAAPPGRDWFAARGGARRRAGAMASAWRRHFLLSVPGRPTPRLGG